ncbi:hypothetical protein CAAN4_C11012 [[Candida] anglica]|uniref:PA14 domain-containing protein n=1 Tax=[Candida] anglica TaxID=148631 RepID=A0ABP0ECE5_9ASCO
MQLFSILSGCLALTSIASATYSPQACHPTGSMSSGLKVNFYPYTLSDKKTMASVEYVSTGYTKNAILKTIDRVSNINFNWQWPYWPWDKGVHYGYIYNYYTTASNFTTELTGYYYAQKTGTHTFFLADIDDSAAFFIGNGVAFNCCEDQPASNPSQYTFFVSEGVGSTRGTAYLQAGNYYPIRVVYSQAVAQAALNFQVTDPWLWTQAVHINTYVFATKFTCPKPVTVTSAWTGKVTSTTTIANGPTTTVEVFTPTVPPVTVTSAWTGKSTTTKTITNGVTTTVQVLTPTIPPVTVTSAWTGSFATTKTITNGATTTVQVLTPTPSSIAPSGWTGTNTVTTTFVSGGSSYVQVLTPTPSSIAPSGWTGTNTVTTTFVSGGSSYVQVLTPTPSSIAPSGWTGTATVTTTFVSGGSSYVQVLTPTPSSIAPSGWTGTATVTTTFVSNGSTYVQVLTPSAVTSATTEVTSATTEVTSATTEVTSDTTKFSTATDVTSSTTEVTSATTVTSSSSITSSKSSSTAVVTSSVSSIATSSAPKPSINPTVPAFCAPQGEATPGLKASISVYPYGDFNINSNIDFMISGYKKYYSFASVTGVTNLTLDLTQKPHLSFINNVWGMSTNQNFVAASQGYFLASETAQFTFSISVDDAAIVQIGDGIAFPCCQITEGGSSSAQLFARSNPTTNELGNATATVSLQKGYYYPFKVVYSNSISNMKFFISASTPNTPKVDIDSALFTFPDSSSTCSAQVKARRGEDTFTNSTYTPPSIAEPSVSAGGSGKLMTSIPALLATLLAYLVL